jgi:hypothetical protein
MHLDDDLHMTLIDGILENVHYRNRVFYLSLYMAG